MSFTRTQSDRIRRCERPRRRHVAVMFADLDHFTRLCFEEPPERAFRLVRDFQRIVADSVWCCGGRLNAYSGDGAMAIFGDRSRRIDCATRALRCARTILEQIVQLDREQIESGERSVSISIGLQYGQILCGTISSSRWFGPTVIGDVVNVANGLEQRAQALGTSLVVGDDLMRKARREAGSDASELTRFVRIGPITVRGRDAPVNVWTRPAFPRQAASPAHAQPALPMAAAERHRIAVRPWHSAHVCLAGE